MRLKDFASGWFEIEICSRNEPGVVGYVDLVVHERK